MFSQSYVSLKSETRGDLQRGSAELINGDTDVALSDSMCVAQVTSWGETCFKLYRPSLKIALYVCVCVDFIAICDSSVVISSRCSEANAKH